MIEIIVPKERINAAVFSLDRKKTQKLIRTINKEEDFLDMCVCEHKPKKCITAFLSENGMFATFLRNAYLWKV